MVTAMSTALHSQYKIAGVNLRHLEIVGNSVLNQNPCNDFFKVKFKPAIQQVSINY